MTVEGSQPTKAVDPQASLRTEMVGQLAAAQLALEAAIAELSRNGVDTATIAASRIQLSSLISLRQQIGTATGSALAELRAEVFAAASSATALAQQANGSASNGNAAGATTRAAAARQAIEHVGYQIFDEKVLDPYLQFASKEDEEAYRKRERERKEEYDKAMALGTPEGARLAGKIALDQARDAGAHGADRSPAFPAIQRDLTQANAVLDAELKSEKEARHAEAATGASTGTQNELDDVMAALAAAGVTTTSGGGPNSKHGLSGGKIASRSTDALQV